MNRSKRAIALVFAVAMMASILVVQGQSPQGETLLIVLDASGSMWGQIDGENKIVIARRVLGELVDGLADGTEVGVIAYGHRREGDCDDIETVVALGPLDTTVTKQTVDGLNPKGKTPITKSLEQAFATLEESGRTATVILISDGLETCGGDPCAAVRTALECGSDFFLHVVGFDVAGEDVSQLECAAQAGNGIFFSAENAQDLSAALEHAVALPVEVPAGRLSVKVVADGALQDAAILITAAGTGEDMGGGRSYNHEGTNPRIIPLPDGKYEVKVQAVGIKGDITRRFAVEVVDGGVVEKVVDYSTGELAIGVTRNGELSDAVFRVLVPDTGKEAAAGRTYTRSASNPATVRPTSGTYQVALRAIEISGDVKQDLGEFVVEPGGRTEVSFNFETGTLKVGAVRGAELVDATMYISDVATGRSAGQGRTYTDPKSNPKTFFLPAGEYRLDVRKIRGERRDLLVTVVNGEEAVHMVEMGGG